MYEKPWAEILVFDTEDVIVTSGNLTDGNEGDNDKEIGVQNVF